MGRLWTKLGSFRETKTIGSQISHDSHRLTHLEGVLTSICMLPA